MDVKRVLTDYMSAEMRNRHVMMCVMNHEPPSALDIPRCDMLSVLDFSRALFMHAMAKHTDVGAAREECILHVQHLMRAEPEEEPMVFKCLRNVLDLPEMTREEVFCRIWECMAELFDVFDSIVCDVMWFRDLGGVCAADKLEAFERALNKNESFLVSIMRRAWIAYDREFESEEEEDGVEECDSRVPDDDNHAEDERDLWSEEF